MKKLSKLLVVALSAMLILSVAACGGKAKVKVVEIKLTQEQYAFAVQKGDTVFAKAANELMNEMKADGSWKTLNDKYLVADSENTIKDNPIIAKTTSTDRSKELVVATNAQFPPFEYKVGNGFLGIDMEIAQKLADKMGRTLVIIDGEFDAVILNVQEGKADIGMAGLTANDKRREIVDFTDNYFDSTQVLIVRADDATFDGIDVNAEDAADKAVAIINKMSETLGRKCEVGAQTGTTGHLFATGDKGFDYDGFNKDTVSSKGLDTGALAVTDLINGSFDLVIIDILPAKSIAASVNK